MVRGFEVQLRCQCQSEELTWVRDTCRAIQGTDGRVLCYEGSLEDITNQRDQTRRIRRLFEAEQQRRQLAETLRRVSMVLSSTLQPNEVLALILEQLGQVLPFDSASVQRLRDDRLEIVACQGFQEPDRVVGLVFPLDPSFPNYRVATTKEPLAFEDVTQEYPHFQAESDAYVSDRIRSWLGVPLMVRDEFIGMIAIDRAGVRPYGDGEVQLAMTFASQAAIAMHNARLFEELEARRVYLEGVLRSVPDAVVTLDAHHQIVEWNSGAEKLFGYSAEEVLGQDLDDLITNPDTLEEAVGLAQVVLRGEDVHPLEATRYRKDGSPVDVIVAGSPIMVGDELIGVVAAYTDITELHRHHRAQAGGGSAASLAGGDGARAAFAIGPQPGRAGHTARPHARRGLSHHGGGDSQAGLPRVHPHPDG
jgi:PAS domain S-box-containing protein